MNVEENRLRTFNEWPANAAVDAARIAKAGFYYIGQGLEVQCFFCAEKITEWNYGDQVMLRHRQISPNCPFVLNPSNTCNVPLLPTEQPSNPLPQTSSTSVEDNDNAETPIRILSAVRSEDPLREYRSYDQRLKSFAKWPIPSIVSPEKLAKAAFYYLQKADLVECIFCRGIVMQWEPGDDPDREHRTHFPNCDFYLLNIDDELLLLGNVKLIPGTTTNFKELGIQKHQPPSQPRHTTYEGRLRTFQNWPDHLKQTPEILSEAGFYYVGMNDQVRCFHCDGGLRNWEITDDAWTEHAKWFPTCGFVNLVKGRDFVKQCCDNRQLDPSIFAGTSGEESRDVIETPAASASSETPQNVQVVSESVLEGLLISPPALAALEIGLQVGRVKRALKRRMEATGIPYTNAHQLIEDVLHDQRMEDDTRPDYRTSNLVSSELFYLLHEFVILNTPNNTSSTFSDSETNDVHVREEIEVETSKPTVRQSDIGKQNTSLDKKIRKECGKELSLEDENRRLKEALLCKICMDLEVGVVFLPCGHLATCVHCAPSLTHCPLCRQDIRATVRTFLS